MSQNQDKGHQTEESVNQEEVVQDTNAQEETAQETVVEQPEEEKEPTLEEQLVEANNKFVRLYAEFENFRKRTHKEKVDLLSTASAGVLKDMLPIMDDFERAIANNENVEDPIALKEGFNLIYNKLKSSLEAKGLKAMQSKGGAFDSEIHEAIANIPAPSKKEVGKVIDDVEKGYYLNDKVIRFAKVVVGQ